MRLRKLKVSGFKSFVDATTIEMPSDLIGIVGPNGCGKSNVIDAVRWVMGESSARHLRGDSMADVIFNGSNARKPVGQAQVELVFDNSEGRLGDRYAAYSEISVKRQVGRDGVSQYALNGTRCRRRDITDLFLGTGLGPRSYAVIEQGMISRLIEARPEELRDYLEEVAGISRYKERRRETEGRIRHTREHLERLTDVREELGRQLQRLDRQARQAERYKIAKAEEREVEAQLLALRWRAMDAEVTNRASEAAQALTAVEAATASLRGLESALESTRESERGSTETANTAYREVLEAAAAVARTEEAITSIRRQREQLDAAVERERATLAQVRARLGSDEQQLGDIEDNLKVGEPALEQLEAQMESAREHYAEQERRMHEWQARWQELANQAQAPSQGANAERARINGLEERLQQISERRQRLEAERQTFDLAGLEARAAAADERSASSRADEQVGADALAGARAEVARLREEAKRRADALHEARARQQQLQGVQASLEALQNDTLRASDASAVTWLEQAGLGTNPRFAELIRVADGWERAVEVVLGDALDLVAVDSLDSVPLGGLAELSDATVGLVAVAPGIDAPAPASTGGQIADGTPLTALASGPAALADLLDRVIIAPDLTTALGMRESLAEGERIITADGIIVAHEWLRTLAGSPGDGVLARAQRLREIETEIDAGSNNLERLERSVSEAATGLGEAEQALAGAQSQANERHRLMVAAQADATASAAELERVRKRHEALAAELGDVESRKAEAGTALAAARARLGEASDSLQAIETERQKWNESRDERRLALEASRDEWQRQRDEGYQLGLRVEGWRTRIKALRDSRERNVAEVERLEQRLGELANEKAALESPGAAADSDLQTFLHTHAAAQTALSRARDNAQGVETRLRELAEQRNLAQAAVEQAREALNGRRLAEHETTVRRETIREQIDATERTPEEWLQALPEEADEAAWTQRLDDLARRISRLGAINLAAIEEHAELSERKQYLDAQNADLELALETLETAIKRIDRETRSRFKDTFEKVNQGLSERFPKLFGGGRAHLQLTGEDVLDAGVAVMAQPPGKRNTSIQLLSGGEKALTAVALVFAMFDLNPAPFCLLDEVDAPLDDANVSRFSELVREMAEQVQMIVVTHNKVTMEVMRQFIGVTMHEPGVSRLVAVDINDAVALAEA